MILCKIYIHKYLIVQKRLPYINYVKRIGILIFVAISTVDPPTTRQIL